MRYFLVLMLLLSTKAAMASSVTLKEVLREVVRIDPRIASSGAAVEGRREDVQIAEEGYYPGVQARVGTEDKFDGVGFEVTVSQMLYDWGQVSARVEKKSTEMNREEYELARVQMEVMQEGIQSYLEMLVNNRYIELENEYIGALENLSDMATQRSSTGYGDNIEAERVFVDLARARAMLAQYYGAYEAAAEELFILSGMDLTEAELTSPATLPIVHDLRQSPGTAENVINYAPAYRVSLAEKEMSKAEVDLRNAERWPTLSLDASWMKSDTNNRGNDDTTIGLSLSTPLFQGLSKFRQPKAARSRMKSAEFQARATKRSLKRKIKQLGVLENTVQARGVALSAELTGGREVRQGYLDQFLSGFRELEDLLAIERDVFQAERQLVELEFELLREQYALASELGVLTVNASQTYNIEGAQYER